LEEFEDGGDGGEGVSFEAVVDVDVGSAAGVGLPEGADEAGAAAADFGLGVLELVVGVEGIDGFLVIASALEEEAGGAGGP